MQAVCLNQRDPEHPILQDLDGEWYPWFVAERDKVFIARKLAAISTLANKISRHDGLLALSNVFLLMFDAAGRFIVPWITFCCAYWCC